MTDNIETEQEAEILAALQTQFNQLGIREAFREVDLSEHNSNSYEFSVPVDNEPTAPVPEGEKMPRKGTQHREKVVQFDKFGFEVNDEASSEDIEDRVEMMYAAIGSHAAKEVYDNVRVSWRKTDNRLNIVRDAIMEAGSTVTYDKQDVVIVPQVLGESIADDDPTREWDEIREDFSDEHSVRVINDQFNVLRGSDVLVVDTDFFGYEAVRTYPETRSYVEYEEHDPARQNHVPEEEREIRQEVTQAYMRLGFAIMDDEAGHMVRFGKM